MKINDTCQELGARFEYDGRQLPISYFLGKLHPTEPTEWFWLIQRMSCFINQLVNMKISFDISTSQPLVHKRRNALINQLYYIYLQISCWYRLLDHSDQGLHCFFSLNWICRLQSFENIFAFRDFFVGFAFLFGPLSLQGKNKLSDDNFNEQFSLTLISAFFAAEK